MVNKKGWLRILEATVSVLIVLAVMLFLQTSKQKFHTGGDFEEIQNKIMQEIAETKRVYVLNYDESLGRAKELEDIAAKNLPANFAFNIRVCKLGTDCQMKDQISIAESSGKSLFVRDRVISSDLNKYNPKVVRLFIWEKDAI